MSPEPRYWFRAKRYGWGGGLPCAWQGWAVLVAYCGLVLGAPYFVSPGIGQVACIAVLTAILIAVYVAKGEPLRWRWGDEKRE